MRGVRRLPGRHEAAHGSRGARRRVPMYGGVYHPKRGRSPRGSTTARFPGPRPRGPPARGGARPAHRAAPRARDGRAPASTPAVDAEAAWPASCRSSEASPGGNRGVNDEAPDSSADHHAGRGPDVPRTRTSTTSVFSQSAQDRRARANRRRSVIYLRRARRASGPRSPKSLMGSSFGAFKVSHASRYPVWRGPIAFERLTRSTTVALVGLALDAEGRAEPDRGHHAGFAASVTAAERISPNRVNSIGFIM
jgi:hypothetical protein